jgi:hypothetical protein
MLGLPEMKQTGLQKRAADFPSQRSKPLTETKNTVENKIQCTVDDKQ